MATTERARRGWAPEILGSLLVLALVVAAAAIADDELGLWDEAPVWVWVVGAVVALAGAALVGAAGASLIEAYRLGDMRDGPPLQLMTWGPYGRVRHPATLGVVLLLAGLGLALDSLLLIGVAACLLPATAWLVLGREEAELAARFEDDYRDYARAVGRWVPRGTPYPRRPRASETAE